MSYISFDICLTTSLILQARFSTRALPPLPARDVPLQETSPNVDAEAAQEEALNEDEPSVDFASSIEKVKDVS